MRRFWMVSAVVVALLAAGLVALNVWAQAYLRGPEFRALVEDRLGGTLGGTVRSAPLQWSGSSVFASEMDLSDGGALQSAAANQLRARLDWRALLRGAWRVEALEIARLDADVRPAPAWAREAPSKAGAGGWVPARFELDRVQVQQARLRLGGGAEWHDGALVMKPDGVAWALEGTGGTLRMPPAPDLAVERVRTRVQRGVVYLTEAVLRSGPAGVITISGEFGGAGSALEMRSEWAGVDVASMARGSWKDRLSGMLAGSAETRRRPGAGLTTTGKFTLSDGRLQGVPLQREIAAFTRTPEFERLPLRVVSGDFTVEGGTTVLRNLVADSPGLLRVEGGARVAADGALSGEFRLGVTASTLQWLPGSQERVFVTAEDGFFWTTVIVGGTLENPTEDLSPRLARAMGEQVIESGAEMLRGAPGSATDAVRRAVDLLSPLIP